MSEAEQESREDLPVMRGRSGPLALAGAVLGVAATVLSGLWWLEGPTSLKPPSLLAVSLSFMALLMGVAALYRVRGMAGERGVRILALVALVLGLGGPLLFSTQNVSWRAAMVGAEMNHVEQIVAACRTYARRNGAYPPSLAALVEAKQLKPEVLVNPVTQEADYLYAGADLKAEYTKAHETSPLIVVYSGGTRLGPQRSVGFADGRQEMLSPEEFAAAWQANNEARAKMGLRKIEPGETGATTQAGATRPAETQTAPPEVGAAPGVGKVSQERNDRGRNALWITW